MVLGCPVVGTEYDFEESFRHGNFVFPAYGTVFCGKGQDRIRW